jgi:monoterpene epsilon-lactone hydrolase
VKIIVSILSIGFLFFLCSTLILLSSQSFYFAVQAQNSSTTHNNNNSNSNTHLTYISTTISKESQEGLRNLKVGPAVMNSQKPHDLAGWKKINQQRESEVAATSEQVANVFQPNVTAIEIADVNVLDIKPKNWKDNGKVMIYTHGGGYTQLSANSTLAAAALVANTTGLRVISIDYTLAPFSKWNNTINQVLNVIRELKDIQGYSPNNIGIFGDSAGGGLALVTVLKMLDDGMGMPAAVVVLSPWTDLTLSGDTVFSIINSDPLLSNLQSIKNWAAAYANPSDQKIPYVSPVYANFSKGFPPILIQAGTREIVLGDSVRLYQALDQADIPVKLDVYEGMPHVFQFSLYNTPESHIAITKMSDFFKKYLNY